jgi:hypothetical protein
MARPKWSIKSTTRLPQEALLLSPMTMLSRNLTQARRSESCVVETTDSISTSLHNLGIEPTDLQGILSLAIWLIDTNSRPSTCSYLSSYFVNCNGIKILVVIIVDCLYDGIRRSKDNESITGNVCLEKGDLFSTSCSTCSSNHP